MRNCNLLITLAGITSSDAVNIAATSSNKSKAAGGAAALFAVSGLCTLAACSWAAAKIVKNNDIGLIGYPGMNIGGGKVSRQVREQFSLDIR